ncbi:MAG: 30S ribosomal protein S4 [Candidatus Nealsonbacteria bacterium]|nr:30S ribosomal protein S4 [Candidatus Nealsonbacteria bacterium]
MIQSKCKICRRVGTKLFLKGEKCISAKCLMIKKPYAPGPRSKRPNRSSSEYAKELREKQRLKNWYNLRDRQFRNYVDAVMEKRGQVQDAGNLLIQKLESRLDNVVYRLGFAASRSQAKQMTTHGHFLVNGKKVDVPSCQIKKGDVVSLRPSSKAKPLFANITAILKKSTPPLWLKLDPAKLEGKVIGEPNLEEVSPPAEISSIFEFYSR